MPSFPAPCALKDAALASPLGPYLHCSRAVFSHLLGRKRKPFGPHSGSPAWGYDNAGLNPEDSSSESAVFQGDIFCIGLKGQMRVLYDTERKQMAIDQLTRQRKWTLWSAI